MLCEIKINIIEVTQVLQNDTESEQKYYQNLSFQKMFCMVDEIKKT